MMSLTSKVNNLLRLSGQPGALAERIEEFRGSLFGVSEPFLPPQLDEHFNDKLLDPVFLDPHSFFTCPEKMEEFNSTSIHLFAQPMVTEHRLCARLGASGNLPTPWTLK